MADDTAGGGLDAENGALGEVLAAAHAAVWGYGVVGAALGPQASAAAAAAVAELSAQAGEQLDRLRAAAPGATASAAPSAPPPAAPEARAWLRGQVAAAAVSHAAACLEQSGARAALLGSIAAGLRGQDGQLA